MELGFVDWLRQRLPAIPHVRIGVGDDAALLDLPSGQLVTTADLLIDTESELKKVTWPTGEEVANSSFVVIVSVLFIMGFLAVADFIIAKLAGRLLGLS